MIYLYYLDRDVSDVRTINSLTVHIRGNTTINSTGTDRSSWQPAPVPQGISFIRARRFQLVWRIVGLHIMFLFVHRGQTCEPDTTTEDRG